MGNVVIRVLKNGKIVPELLFLIVCKEISAANHITVAGLYNKSMHLLWPKLIKYDNVLLFITDSVLYTKKAEEALCVSYLKLIHVTYVVHAVHRVCETIRSLYPNVDRTD